MDTTPLCLLHQHYKHRNSQLSYIMIITKASQKNIKSVVNGSYPVVKCTKRLFLYHKKRPYVKRMAADHIT